MKQISGLCGIGEKMKQWKYRELDVCPLCNEIEYNMHVLRCNSIQANQKELESIDALKNHLLDNNTRSNTVNIIVNQLHLWQENMHTLPINAIRLSAAILSQKYICWQAFIEGCLSTEWKIHESTFLTKNTRILDIGQLCLFKNCGW